VGGVADAPSAMHRNPDISRIRKGGFAGMLQKRIFNVVLVKEGHGIDIETTTGVNRVVQYNGKAQIVQL